MGSVGIGVPELMVVLFIVVVWAIPLAAAVWALFTLHRMRGEQRAMRRTVENIEQLLQRR
jgi:hypothetical protein